MSSCGAPATRPTRCWTAMRTCNPPREANRETRAGKVLRRRQPRLLRQLKPLEAVELVLDRALQLLAPRGFLALPDPGPFLHQQLLRLPIGLEIERGDDLVADQNGECEIAELALGLRHIGFEQMIVAEDEIGALALDDQGIERREDVDEIGRRLMQLQRRGSGP